MPASAPSSEKAVFAALTKLADPWHVFHSVAWQSLRNGKQGDGEADELGASLLVSDRRLDRGLQDLPVGVRRPGHRHEVAHCERASHAGYGEQRLSQLIPGPVPFPPGRGGIDELHARRELFSPPQQSLLPQC